MAVQELVELGQLLRRRFSRQLQADEGPESFFQWGAFFRHMLCLYGLDTEMGEDVPKGIKIFAYFGGA